MSDEERLIAGRYRILDRVGRGGMGTVWRAHDTVLGRHVAVKRLHPQPHLSEADLATLFERTRREARSAARISHPNVVVVHDVVDDEGLPTIVMEYVPSTTLADVIRVHGPVPPQEAARIGLGVLAALRAAHRAGVLHRDVKPANVLLTEDDRVVLTDFGIAQASDTSTLTVTGQLVGSVDFIAPERLAGARPGPEADLWALGATLFQAVDGHSPFLRDSVTETMYAIALGPVPEVRRAGPLTPLINGLIANKPGERLSAEEAEHLLRTAATTPTAPTAAALYAEPGNLPPKQEPAPAPEPETETERSHGKRVTAAAEAAPNGPPPRSPRWRKPVVLGTAITAAVLIAISLLVTQTLEKGGTSAPAADVTTAAGDKTVPRTPATSPSPSVTPSPSDSRGSDTTSPPTEASSPSLPATDAPGVDTGAVPGTDDTSTKSGSGATAAPTGHALVVAASGKCLSRGNGAAGIQLFQDTCDGSAQQRWRIGSGIIRSAGKCMTVAGGATDDRTAIQLAGCDGSGSQQFRLDGTELLAGQSQKCVDIFGGASGTVAVLWECNGRDNQIWTLG